VLVEYPLPRLQRVAGGEERFIYEIGWGEGVSRRAFLASKRGVGEAFDNRILFVAGAAEALAALAPVVRPLVQQQWTAMVQRINDLPAADHEEFLFGATRVGLGALHRPLRLLQGGRCFYCGGGLAGSAQVDHFLPWSRYPDDGLDNLVLAHERCNRDKLHFLADLTFGRRWEERSRERSADLDEIVIEQRWTRDRARTFGVVASVYSGLPEGVRLWSGDGRFKRLGTGDLDAVRDFGRSLIAR
jgi:5-methylcytosine-specific restriction endonuclease McrA